MPRSLPQSFYARATVVVAREFLGCVLARCNGGDVLRLRIVETEAYVGESDRACHARAGRTPRTEVMYGAPGRAYVYFTYGMHYLLNAVTEPEGVPAAVLIRAGEPLEGIERMARARRVERARDIASGPAKLCQALSLDLRQNQADLRGPVLWIEPGEVVPDGLVATSPRVGCHTVSAPWDRIPWRFFIRDSPFVSPVPKSWGSLSPRHRT